MSVLLLRLNGHRFLVHRDDVLRGGRQVRLLAYGRHLPRVDDDEVEPRRPGHPRRTGEAVQDPRLEWGIDTGNIPRNRMDPARDPPIELDGKEAHRSIGQEICIEKGPDRYPNPRAQRNRVACLGYSSIQPQLNTPGRPGGRRNRQSMSRNRCHSSRRNGR